MSMEFVQSVQSMCMRKEELRRITGVRDMTSESGSEGFNLVLTCEPDN